MRPVHLDELSLGPGDALLVTDVQNDFLPGGALAVRNGDEILAPLDRAIRVFRARGLPVFATRDWHPPDHLSFHDRGGPWPRHCVQGTPGAAFSPHLALPPDAIVISKATDPDREAYSSFEGTDLRDRLRQLEIRRLVIGGLTAEYCVFESVRDALADGLDVAVLVDSVRGIDARPGDGEQAIQRMLHLGAAAVVTGASAAAQAEAQAGRTEEAREPPPAGP